MRAAKRLHLGICTAVMIVSLHMIDRTIAGVMQCQVVGTCPW